MFCYGHFFVRRHIIRPYSGDKNCCEPSNCAAAITGQHALYFRHSHWQTVLTSHFSKMLSFFKKGGRMPQVLLQGQDLCMARLPLGRLTSNLAETMCQCSTSDQALNEPKKRTFEKFVSVTRTYCEIAQNPVTFCLIDLKLGRDDLRKEYLLCVNF